jgi:Spy/CpxP family protein refolding chaperone
MDRKIIADRLAQAERHVAQGDGHIKKQRELIAQLEENRFDTARAKELLDTFISLQKAHIAERDTLRGELKKKKRALGSTTD